MSRAEHAEAIRTLIHRYAETIDRGDAEGYAALFARATFRVGGTSIVLEGAEAVLEATRRALVWYPDGLGTRHVITNLSVDVAEDERTATASSYGLLLQARPDFPLQVVQTAQYRDRFERDENGWYWVDHVSENGLMGDTSHHLRTRRRRPGRPRLPPLGYEDMDPELARRLVGTSADMPTGRPANVVATLAHHVRLSKASRSLGGVLYPGQGLLSARDSELVVLRTAAVTRNRYEWEQHAHSGRANLAEEEIARVLLGPDAPGWSAYELHLLRAVDELVATATMSDASWDELSETLSPAQIIETMYVVGYYRTLGGVIQVLRVEPDEGLDPAAPTPADWG